jgi:hypothetical protein
MSAAHRWLDETSAVTEKHYRYQPDSVKRKDVYNGRSGCIAQSMQCPRLNAMSHAATRTGCTEDVVAGRLPVPHLSHCPVTSPGLA